MRAPRILVLAAVTLVTATPVAAQRERMRQTPRADRSTSVSESQASELTLTLTEVAVRPIQVWVRTAGVLDQTGTNLVASVYGSDKDRIAGGQRIRAFSPESRSRMYQATVTHITAGADHVVVTARLAGATFEASRHFVLEIVTEPGEFLSVPNEAIIESGGERIVYVLQKDGSYAPRVITPGMQGELYTQVVGGVTAGEQVVTTGSFFIDAEHKLKG